MFRSLLRLGYDMTMLGIESQQVIALRLTRIALGGAAAEHETRRMVSEKATAAVETGMHLATGGSPHKVVSSYRHKVRANRDRLFGTMFGG